MNAYERDRTYDDGHRTVDYAPTFNSDSKLEFNILTRVSITILFTNCKSVI